jgi:hypothetical protein
MLSKEILRLCCVGHKARSSRDSDSESDAIALIAGSWGGHFSFNGIYIAVIVTCGCY